MIYGMNIARPDLENALRRGLAQSPAVALLGPRQVGKTTLAKALARETKDSVYLDLERVSDLRKLEDPRAFLQTQTGRLTIIDEVHRAPSLFAELRGIIDDRRQTGERTGHFLLLGSASLDLVQQASETLAGRIIYLEMPPIGLEEANAAGIAADRLWLRGGFPDSLTARDDEASYIWRQNFLRSYLERDVPMFAPRMPSSAIGRLWAMLANAQGTTLNAARLAQGLGVSAPTVSRYIDLLADLLLLRRLAPWSGNLNKRLVRSPKIYVRDSGLTHALLEIGPLNQLLGHPIVGPSWEGFAIEALVTASESSSPPLFYRTADGSELDLVFEKGGRPFIGIEVKRSSAPKIGPGFQIACDDLEIEHRLVVSGGEDSYQTKGGVQVTSLIGAVQKVRELMATPFAGLPED
jgi:uncharacterized protein